MQGKPKLPRVASGFATNACDIMWPLMKRNFLIAVSALFFCFQARAGLVEDLKSPVTTDAKWIALSGTGLTLAVILTQDSWSGPWETWTARHQPLGESSKYGDLLGQVMPNALYAGGMWAAGYLGSERGLGRAWTMVKVTAYSALISTALKQVAGEGRPYNSERGSSFPSGHSTTAFAFAGVVAAEHGWWYGTPAMLMATFVAYSRINDNQHRLHDVVAGATIGLTCAYGIHFAGQGSENPVKLFPMPVKDGAGLVAFRTF